MKVLKGERARQWKMGHQVDSRWELIQQLIPIGIQAVERGLMDEVARVTGSRYSRKENGCYRWGANDGSVFLGDTKVSVRVPRVRDAKQNREVVLDGYERLQDPQGIDNRVFERVLKGISQRDYESAALHAPEVFGVKKSSVSRAFIRASSARLREVMERRFDREDFVAIFLDGKSLLDTSMIIALGIRGDGSKAVLGFTEATTENHRVCSEFLQNLKERGLRVEEEVLIVIDGSKGLRKAVDDVFGDRIFIQRCQWHKRENVVSYLSDRDKDRFRKRLQAAYEKPTYDQARRELMAIYRELKLLNESAARSLEEGLEETLTLHRLKLFPQLGASFKTTNAIENVNGLLQRRIGRICSWKNSSQRQRWIASALLDVEPRLNRIRGYQSLSLLRIRMKELNEQRSTKVVMGVA